VLLVKRELGTEHTGTKKRNAIHLEVQTRPHMNPPKEKKKKRESNGFRSERSPREKRGENLESQDEGIGSSQPRN